MLFMCYWIYSGSGRILLRDCKDMKFYPRSNIFPGKFPPAGGRAPVRCRTGGEAAGPCGAGPLPGPPRTETPPSAQYGKHRAATKWTLPPKRNISDYQLINPKNFIPCTTIFHDDI